MLAAEGLQDEDSSPEVGRSSTPALGGLRSLDLLDRYGILIAAIGTIALAPGFFYVTNPRQALVLSTIPLTLYLLGMRALHRDRASIAAVVCIMLATVSAFRAEHPLLAVTGTIVEEPSLLALIAGFGLWALGRELSVPARDFLVLAVTAGAAVSIALGLLQVALRPPLGIYASPNGRASGLMSNPVYFASVLAGVWGYWFVRAALERRVARIIVVGVLALGMGMTGSRGAVAGAVLIIGIVTIWQRSRSVALAGSASIVGFLGGYSLLTFALSQNAERFQGSGDGLGMRQAVWRTTLDAIGDRPWLGWGFDPYLSVPNEQLPISYARDFQYLVWTDPHNVVLHALHSLGLLGIAAIGLFLAMALRGRRSIPHLAAVVAIVLSWMLQPVTINSWPLACLFLGAGVLPASQGDRPRLDGRRLKVLVGVGLSVASVFFAWSIAMRAAVSSGNGDAVERRAGFMISDPAVAVAAGRAHLRSASEDPADEHLQRAEALFSRALSDGGAPNTWVLLINTQLIQRRPDAAFETASRWVERRPNDPFGLRLLGLTANLTGREDVEREAIDKLCFMRQPPCESGTPPPNLFDQATASG